MLAVGVVPALLELSPPQHPSAAEQRRILTKCYNGGMERLVKNQRGQWSLDKTENTIVDRRKMHPAVSTQIKPTPKTNPLARARSRDGSKLSPKVPNVMGERPYALHREGMLYDYYRLTAPESVSAAARKGPEYDLLPPSALCRYSTFVCENKPTEFETKE